VRRSFASLAVVAGLATAWGPAPASAQDRSILWLLDSGRRTLVLGALEAGSLTADDVVSAEGHRVQAWTLRAAPGDRVRVDLRSDDFDALLFLLGPGLGSGARDDDGGEGVDARLCFTVSVGGEYRVVAAARGGGEGRYTLQAAEQGAGEGSGCPEGRARREVTEIADLPTEGRTLAVGRSGSGVLGVTDPYLSGSPAQAWAVEGRAGEPFSVDMISEDFDPFLLMAGPGLAEWLEDDDGGGACNARIQLTFPADGSYRLVASSLGGATGAYRLVATTVPPDRTPGECLGVDRPVDRGPPDIAGVTIAGRLEADVAREGMMTGAEGTVGDRSVQAWTLEAAAGDRYAIELHSDDFDAYLHLGGPGFGELVTDDDSAGSLDARLCVQLPEDGTYTIYGGPLSGRAPGGRFTILAAEADAEARCNGAFDHAPAEILDVLSALPTEGRSIGVGEERVAFLDPAGPRHPESGRTLQPWALDAPAGTRVFVDVVSDDFDAALYVVAPGMRGATLADDVGAGICHARLELTSAGPGTLLLPAGYEVGASGTYRLRVTTDPPPMEPGGCVGSPAGGATTDVSLDHLSSGTDRRLTVGTEMDGTLGPGDERLLTGAPAQSWSVEVRAGEELVFELLSDDFDSVLYLDGAGTVAPLMDDDGAGGLNARIVFTPPEDGRVRLVVSAFTEDAAGAFRLHAIRRVR